MTSEIPPQAETKMIYRNLGNSGLKVFIICKYPV